MLAGNTRFLKFQRCDGKQHSNSNLQFSRYQNTFSQNLHFLPISNVSWRSALGYFSIELYVMLGFNPSKLETIGKSRRCLDGNNQRQSPILHYFHSFAFGLSTFLYLLFLAFGQRQIPREPGHSWVPSRFCPPPSLLRCYLHFHHGISRCYLSVLSRCLTAVAFILRFLCTNQTTCPGFLFPDEICIRR